MKPAPFRYHDPRTKAEALELIAANDNAQLLAGGQSLLPMLNFRIAMPDHVIDLGRISGLNGIERRDGVLAFGAMTRQCDAQESALVRECAPILAQALGHVGHRQTRNRGTIGGSLCHFDPAAELVAAASALDAILTVESSRAVRRISIHDWGQGYMSTALGEDEMLTSLELPIWPKGHGYAFVEYARRQGDFAIVAVAALLTLDDAGAIARAAVAIGGCAACPVRLAPAEQALRGQRPDAKLLHEVSAVAKTIDAIADAYVPASYRQHLARVLTERALSAALRRAVSGQ